MADQTLSLNKQRTSSSTVTVASKIPMDFVLQLHTKRKEYEPVVGGGTREYLISRPDHTQKPYLINGNSHEQNASPRAQIHGGYAITPGIPREFWEKWKEQNEGHDALVNGMLFAHEEQASTLSEATEKMRQRSGLERVDPDNIPPEFGIPKSVTKGERS